MKKHFLKSFALLAMLFSALTVSAGTELFNPATTKLSEVFIAYPDWVPDGVSSATYDANTGVISVDIKNQLNGQWKGQVKLQHDITFAAGKKYQCSMKFRANTAVNRVTLKIDDNTGMIFEDQAINIPANEDYVYTSAIVDGAAGNNNIIVFDFGWAPACQIVISDISIQEVEPTPEPETPSVVYCDFPTGHNGDANFGDANGRILVSLIKKSETEVRLVVKSADAATKNLDLLYVEAAGANPHATTVGSDVAESDLREMSIDITYPTAPAKYAFMIQWSHPDWDGRWQTNLNDITVEQLCTGGGSEGGETPDPTPDPEPEPETPSIVYCDFPTGHNGDANFGDANGRILVSLIKKSETEVRLVVKSADAATKNLDLLYVEAAGANPHATTVGSDVAESDLREMSIDITYPTAPAKYAFMIQWSNPEWDGRWQINLNDVLESNLCPLPTDDEAPVMVSASLVTGSETYNSAVLTVSATDNDEVANYHVVDATNDYNATIAPVGNQITLTDLTPSTTYNFTVTALDLAGNESENSKTVAVSTHTLEYCEWIIGSENRTDWADANRLCLLTISKITDKQLLVVAKPVSGANKLDFLQVQADGASHQTVTSPATDELSIVLDFANTITEIPLFRILWSNEDVEENWMTDLKNVKASYLCPHIELGESVDLSKLDLSAGVTTDVKITRKFVKGSGKWNTLSLPFGLDAADIATAFGSAKVVELSGATLVTSTDIDLSVSNVSEIVAGKPYLIQIPASYAPAVIENITLSNTVTAQETATANGLAKMVSVLTPIEFDDAAGGIRFFLNTNGKLSYRSTTNGIMNPYRAYFEFPHINDPATASQVRARVVFNENTETGVDNLITTDAPVKVIENGQLIIIRGGVKYNVQGQKL